MNKIFISLLIFTCINIIDINTKCNCDRKDYYKDIFNCDTTFLDNGSYMYWEMDCDSAHFYLHNKDDNRYSLTRIDSEVEYDYVGRLGLGFVKEYKDYLLFKWEIISGCCTPPNIILLNKYDAKIIDTIDSYQYIHVDVKNDWFIYNEIDSMERIVLMNLHNMKKSYHSIDMIEYKKAYNELSFSLYGDLYTDFKMSGDTIQFLYAKETNWARDTIKMVINR